MGGWNGSGGGGGTEGRGFKQGFYHIYVPAAAQGVYQTEKVKTQQQTTFRKIFSDDHMNCQHIFPLQAPENQLVIRRSRIRSTPRPAIFFRGD